MRNMSIISEIPTQYIMQKRLSTGQTVLIVLREYSQKMARVLLIIVTATLSAAIQAASIDKGGCTCGVFPDNDAKPIIERSLQYNVTCDEEGSTMCQNLCIALAQGARDKAPAMICEKLDTHVENLKVAVFTKSCYNKDVWKFTGLESPAPICCHGGKEILCNSQAGPSAFSPDALHE